MTAHFPGVQCRRQHMSLLEIMIALGLVSMLLTAVLGIYSYLNSAHLLMDKSREENFRLRYVQSRLSGVISKAVSPIKKDFVFFSDDQHDGTTGSSLVFTYDNGVDINPLFSNHDLARLYVDKHHNLCLVSWPSPKRWDKGNPPPKKEVLLNDVKKIIFTFYAPPLMNNKVIQDTFITAENEKKDPTHGIWNTTWLQSYKQLPAMIKIQVYRDITKANKLSNDVLTFVYPMANAQKNILYKQ